MDSLPRLNDNAKERGNDILTSNNINKIPIDPARDKPASKPIGVITNKRN